MPQLTPMMRQYMKVKQKYPDELLFFRMGDFYEMFFEDAKIVSNELDIALTSRNQGSKEPIPMAGVPHHSVQTYIARLIKKGYRVALCDQVEDPKLARGLVRREVIRIITPGTVLDDISLEKGSNNFLLSLSRSSSGNSIGVAFIDISTGDFLVTQFEGEDALDKLLIEISRFRPSECLIPASLVEDEGFLRSLKDQSDMLLTPRKDWSFSLEKGRKELLDHFHTVSLEGFGCENLPQAISAAGAALEYVQETSRSSLIHINQLRTYFNTDYLILDSTTQRNLEITHNIRDNSRRGTLLEIILRTVTAMGSRLLHHWLLQPLWDVEEIRKRQDAVEVFYQDVFLRQDLRELLRGVSDLQRLVGRISSGNANARDLVSLRDSLKQIPKLRALLSRVPTTLLQSLAEQLDEVGEAISIVDRAIEEEPPLALQEGGLIRRGYNEQLDEIRDSIHDSKEWIASLESRERKRTGIKNLKVGFNKVFGYYIEVTKSNLRMVPDDYIRKQTLVNAERFITPQLKEYESRVLGAEERINTMEYELFVEVRENVALYTERIQRTAGALAQLDVLSALAEVAVENDYVKPEVNGDDKIIIKRGRHPMVERFIGRNGFIPNDAYIDNEERRLVIVTGPNMSGKSTYLRQIAIIVLMAQMGSFVPADQATIGVVDRIFTRVGAYDDLTMGQSTFMVEMNETANILNNATSRSLIILDEIGRGTSTFDGLSIAWAVAEYIHQQNKIGAKTLFATHYHQLTELEELLPGVKNCHISIVEKDDELIFIREVVDGQSDRSYGIQVAKLAGLPEEVIGRASDILKKLEEEAAIDVRYERSRSKGRRSRARKSTTDTGQLPLFTAAPDPIIEELKRMDVTNMTPLEALNKLYELKKKASD